MIRTIAKALDDAAAGPGGFVFVAPDGRESVQPFKELRESALDLGGALRARGLDRGDYVAIVIPDADGFLTAFLGASAAGLVPMPLAYPHDATQLDAYFDTMVPLFRLARARAVVTTPRLLPLLSGLPAAAPTVRFVTSWTELKGPALSKSERIDVDAPALLQFTSGSTSQPKGVVLTHANIAANVEAIGGPAGLGFGPEEVGVSWLPLFHDMGLIGQALCAVYSNSRTVFLSPMAFLKRPVEWLRAITSHRGTVSFAPNFAYEMCVRRIKDAELDGLDLSSWRVAGCGAEPIQAATLEAFAARFAPVGFRAASLLSAYGLAEHTLAVSLAPRDRGLRVDTVHTSELAASRRAVPCSPDASDASRLVACGGPFPGHLLRVVDDRGGPAGERVVGEILVSGPSVMQGYLSGPEATAEVVRDGWLATGDLGYVADGELYVCGRRKETIIVGGRNYFPQDLESVVDGVPGVRSGRVAAFAATAPGYPDRAVVVVETSEDVPADAVQAEVRRRVLQATGLAVDEIVLAPKGTIARTTSGKLRRAELRARYVAGTLVHQNGLVNGRPSTP
jgi:fatty-acyl-CoA synthase